MSSCSICCNNYSVLVPLFLLQNLPLNNISSLKEIYYIKQLSYFIILILKNGILLLNKSDKLSAVSSDAYSVGILNALVATANKTIKKTVKKLKFIFIWIYEINFSSRSVWVLNRMITISLFIHLYWLIRMFVFNSL